MLKNSSSKPIDNCEFEFDCPVAMDKLKDVDAHTKFCTQCKENVHVVYNDAQLEYQSSAGHCIGYYPALSSSCTVYIYGAPQVGKSNFAISLNIASAIPEQQRAVVHSKAKQFTTTIKLKSIMNVNCTIQEVHTLPTSMNSKNELILGVYTDMNNLQEATKVTFHYTIHSIIRCWI